MAKSIKSRIDELVSKLGELPAPSPGFIKGKLVTIGNLVEALENGAAMRDAEAKVEILESENAKLKIEFQKANTELDTFRAERKQQEQEEKKKEIPDVQYKILRLLPSEHGGEWLNIYNIAIGAGILIDEAEVHIERLRRLGFATDRTHETKGTSWHRSNTGNELVLAKRLAGDEEDEKRYADLPNEIHDALLIIAKGEGNGASESEIAERLGITSGQTRIAVECLRSADFANQHPDDPGRKWYLMSWGARYLIERDLL